MQWGAQKNAVQKSTQHSSASRKDALYFPQTSKQAGGIKPSRALGTHGTCNKLRWMQHQVT